MRVLIWGISPAINSGYGIGAGQLALRLREEGHEVAIYAMAGQMGDSNWRDVPVFGGRGRDDISLLPVYAEMFKADLVVAWFDFWRTAGDLDPKTAPPIVAYPLVDAVPLSETFAFALKSARAIVAATDFGRRTMEAGGLRPWETIPHGVDLEAYSPGDRPTARRMLGIPESSFVALSVVSNLDWRKNISGMMSAWRRFVEHHPDAVWMLWTDVSARMHDAGSYDVWRLWRSLDPKGKNLWTPGTIEWSIGLSPAGMARLYRAADVYLSCTWGEGFCFPVIEAAACGIPTIGADNSTYPELLGPEDAVDLDADDGAPAFGRTERGWLVDEAARIAQPRLHSWQSIPSEAGIVGALEDAAAETALRHEKGRRARAVAEQAWGWETVGRSWSRVLGEIRSAPRLEAVRPQLVVPGRDGRAS